MDELRAKVFADRYTPDEPMLYGKMGAAQEMIRRLDAREAEYVRRRGSAPVGAPRGELIRRLKLRVDRLAAIAEVQPDSYFRAECDRIQDSLDALRAGSAPPANKEIRMIETAEEQIERLADFIMQEIPGEPSQSEGAVDTAIRLLRAAPPTAPSPWCQECHQYVDEQGRCQTRGCRYGPPLHDPPLATPPAALGGERELADAVRELEQCYWHNSYPQPHGQPDGVSIPRCTPLRIVLDAVTDMLPESLRPQVRFGRSASPPSQEPNRYPDVWREPGLNRG